MVYKSHLCKCPHIFNLRELRQKETLYTFSYHFFKEESMQDQSVFNHYSILQSKRKSKLTSKDTKKRKKNVSTSEILLSPFQADPHQPPTAASLPPPQSPFLSPAAVLSPPPPAAQLPVPPPSLPRVPPPAQIPASPAAAHPPVARSRTPAAVLSPAAAQMPVPRTCTPAAVLSPAAAQTPIPRTCTPAAVLPLASSCSPVPPAHIPATRPVHPVPAQPPAHTPASTPIHPAPAQPSTSFPSAAAAQPAPIIIFPAPPPPLHAFISPLITSHQPSLNPASSIIPLEVLSDDDDELDVETVANIYNNLEDLFQLQETTKLLCNLEDAASSSVSSVSSAAPSPPASIIIPTQNSHVNKIKKNISISKEVVDVPTSQPLSSSSIPCDKYWWYWRREMEIKNEMSTFHEQIDFFKKKIISLKCELKQINILKNE